MKKCLLIINPKAGQKRICRELVNVIDELNRAGYKTNVFVTSADENAAVAAKQVTDEELVVCAGGDGTLKQVISTLIDNNKNVNVGYIPCGSTNDFAATIGLSKNIKKAIKSIVDGDVIKYDVGKFNTMINGEYIPDHFVYVASFGLFSSASYNTPQNVKNNLGHMAYALNGLSELVDASAYRVKVNIGNESITGDYILGMVANTLSVGGVIKLDPVDVDLSDGLFEILLIKQPNTLIEFNEILDGLMRRDFSGEMFVFKKASSISLQFEEEATWSLDGEESLTSNFFKIDNLNQVFSLVK